MIALIIDGLDIQLLALVSPLILDQWGIDKASFGPALSAALIGMALGASIGGHLGDRFGRKLILVTSIFVFGTATALASLTENVASMAALRLISGFGFGAAAPNGIALASEWLPAKHRSLASGALSVGTPLGGMLGASTVLMLIPSYGWQGCFVACGVITLVLVIIMVLSLPESPSFLINHGKAGAAVRQLKHIASLDIPFEEHAQSSSTKTRGEKIDNASLFARENARTNLGAWLAFFSIQFVAYTFAAWTPVLLTMAQFDLADAVTATVAFNLCAVAAAITASALINQLGSRRLMLLTSIGALLGVLLLGAGVIGHLNAPGEPGYFAIILIANGLVGGLTGACIAAIYALLAYAYPVSCRASGVGFGLMMGRAGGIVTTLVSGALLEAHTGSTKPFFAVLAMVSLCAFVGTLIIDRHIPTPSRV